MKKETQFQRDLSEACTLMQELDEKATQHRGGYWADWGHTPGFFLCATTRGEDEPELLIYRNTDIVKAFREAKRALKSGRRKDIEEAFYENYPPTRFQARQSVKGADT